MAVDNLDIRAEQAIEGDHTALEEILRTLQPIIERYCRAHLGSYERPIVSPDDLTQEVLLAVCSALPRYRRASGPLIAFVLGIAARNVANARRTLMRNRSEASSDTPELFERRNAIAGPEEHVVNRAGGRMEALLDQLSDHQRKILFLRVVAGFSVEEVAIALACSEGAVRVAQSRALSRMRDLLHVRRKPARGGPDRNAQVRFRRENAELTPARSAT